MGNTIHDRLKKLLDYSELSQNKFANKIGVDSGAMSRILKGGGFNHEVLMEVAKKFPKISSEWLLRGKGEMLIKNSDSATTSKELESEITWLKEQLSKALSVSENTAEEAKKYRRDLIDIDKILKNEGIDLEELIKASSRRAV